MAASFTWPVTLPQEPLFGGFNETYGYNFIVSPMDAGPAKIRRRSTRGNPAAVTFLMTTAQVTTLKNFVDSTIAGVARFYFTHPRTASQIEVRLLPTGDGALYSVEQAAPGYWNVSLTMEQLP